MHMVMGSNPGIFLIHTATIFLVSIIQKITIQKLCISQQTITIHHCVTILYVTLVSILTNEDPAMIIISLIHAFLNV
jgi:hypothetical protein